MRSTEKCSRKAATSASMNGESGLGATTRTSTDICIHSCQRFLDATTLVPREPLHRVRSGRRMTIRPSLVNVRGERLLPATILPARIPAADGCEHRLQQRLQHRLKRVPAGKLTKMYQRLKSR